MLYNTFVLELPFSIVTLSTDPDVHGDDVFVNVTTPFSSISVALPPTVRPVTG